MIRLSVDRSLYVALGAAAGAAALVGAVFPASMRYGFNVVPLSAFAVAAALVLAVHFTPAGERIRGIGTGALAGGLVAASITFYVTGNLWKARYAAVGGGAMGAAVGTQFGIAVDGFQTDRSSAHDADASSSSRSSSSSSSPSSSSSSSRSSSSSSSPSSSSSSSPSSSSSSSSSSPSSSSRSSSSGAAESDGGWRPLDED